MIVDIDGKAWEMNSKIFTRCLDMAKQKYMEAHKHAIYCVSRAGVAFMKKEEFALLSDLYAQVKKYLDMGFRVYYNVGRNSCGARNV